MKIFGGVFSVAFLALGLMMLSSTAQAYRYGNSSAVVHQNEKVQYRHKVRIRYRRRVGRRYGRRIASFVRFGPYTTRRSIRRSRKNRRSRRRR